ncbi:prolyl oligopeptidase family protein [Microbacterium sp.]|uniref:prolyl oligopeptidase family serine peptidase n=1 Tax=Microbacterium sp. TaxID=51671 RepID=UPI001ACAE2C5|nr:prolyl oligopeptidase family serine peptidase [Microbacterium sp.]MBN9193262.1 S9 family peptidase [Microbacterium sp.]
MPADPAPASDSDRADPYLWLEEIHADDALAWAADRTADTERIYASAERTALEERLRAVLDDPDRLVVAARHGDWMYDLWRDAANPRGLWRRSPRAAFRAGRPEWQVLLDLDALGTEEGVAWAFGGALHGPAGTDRVLLQLSPDGGDAHVTREFDLAAVGFVDDTPFGIPVDKARAAWLDRDTLLVAATVDGGAATESGYPATARVWRRGTPLADAPVVVSATRGDVGVFVGVDRTDGITTAVVDVWRDFFHTDVHVWDAASPAAPRIVAVPQDAHVDVHGELVTVRTTTPWTLGGRTHEGGTLLVGPLRALVEGDGDGEASGGDALVPVFVPSAHAVLESWTWTKRRLVLTILEDVQSRLVALDPADGWAATELPAGIDGGDLLSVGVATRDADEDDELWLVARGFLTPATLVVTDAVASGPVVVDRAREVFDASGLTAVQHWATSADGTRIPYFEVGPRERDGVLPVLMSGYGGFEHALTPEYPSLVGPAWLERGNVFVVANIRGGGEFGPAWHLAALRENRHRAYEDFAAVARDLVARGVTTADRIGCHGRSNGGLLVGNMLTQFPEDFGAIVCGVPLLDMRRYTRLSAGASWIAEYGDPDDPDDWAFVQTFSPYHLVEGGRAYPPSLIYAATSDDRVGPVQARKMAARLQDETDAEVHYLEPAEGGHAGSIDNAATAALHATIYAFLDDVLAQRPRG